MSFKLIYLCLLITQMRLIVCENSTDYSYDDFDEEIPGVTITTDSTKPTDSPSVHIFEEEEKGVNDENENQFVQLEKMSNTFKRIVNKYKLKHKKLEIIFLIDASSSVGKENFENEISFVKRLLSDFNVSYNYTRVALITFSSKSKIVSQINSSSFLLLLIICEFLDCTCQPNF